MDEYIKAKMETEEQLLNTLKEIRGVLNNINIFEASNYKKQNDALQEINEILERMCV